MRATPEGPTNEEIAQILDLVAELLEAQEANRFRVAAYRRAAETLRKLESKALDILETGGLAGLASLPGIGESLARAIAEILETGGLQFLERLGGQAAPEVLFATVPGIGPRLAAQIHDELGIETLEELESAAHDGRLARVRGFGPRRLRAIAESLASRLGRRARRSTRRAKTPPPVAELLGVDREYRDKAATGKLRRIAPRRFNPERKAWLPILHAVRGDRHYTALFSNTVRAHELGRTNDWVVLYLDDGQSEQQSTVVTETRGPLAGRRVVRGREEECREYYDAHPNGSSLPAQDF
ncbi:MAG TPA: helix-hairpin-helix domain-containing protein [Vicinamibacteria bacterium]|nr:helix-hairpin-helix domain-containing protein [Vicinamibacteria bacterium]